MSLERSKLRGVVLAEDKRTERFFRGLLKELGFDARRFRFVTAPSGRGAGDAFVAQRYPGEVEVLRRKNYQRGLRLIAVRDEDGKGLSRRKEELDASLKSAGMPSRTDEECIATPVPARNIETWLLALIGDEVVNETEDWKRHFEQLYRDRERDVLRQAAASWSGEGGSTLPSLQDGRAEMERLG